VLENILAAYPETFRRQTLPKEVEHEAKRRILDAVGCFYGAFAERPVVRLREALSKNAGGRFQIWGTNKTASAEVAAWANGTGVRALDFNDTYLSLEPCHPSDLLASLWIAAQASGSKQQGRLVVRAMVLGYEVLCRLCDAGSLRARGWDHVTYLPIASAVACSYILGLNRAQTRHAIALAAVGNNALRQTRVGSISDWKAACAAYASRAGLWAALLAQNDFTGPSDIFSGRHGFFRQVSGPLRYNSRPLGKKWKIMSTHTKYFPAEHHAQSAIEAALLLYERGLARRRGKISSITIESFKAAVEIIGSEREKWMPSTRETADHSMPYLVVAALLDGEVSLKQFRRQRYLDADVRRLLAHTKVVESKKYTRLYPGFLPNQVAVRLTDGSVHRREILLPKGYAGRAMTDEEIVRKYTSMATGVLSTGAAGRLARVLLRLERVGELPKI
jgi:2-methylcitrate dehydratase